MPYIRPQSVPQISLEDLKQNCYRWSKDIPPYWARKDTSRATDSDSIPRTHVKSQMCWHTSLIPGGHACLHK